VTERRETYNRNQRNGNGMQKMEWRRSQHTKAAFSGFRCKIDKKNKEEVKIARKKKDCQRKVKQRVVTGDGYFATKSRARWNSR
jgi:hypothetical protein